MKKISADQFLVQRISLSIFHLHGDKLISTIDQRKHIEAIRLESSALINVRHFQYWIVYWVYIFVYLIFALFVKLISGNHLITLGGATLTFGLFVVFIELRRTFKRRERDELVLALARATSAAEMQRLE